MTSVWIVAVGGGLLHRYGGAARCGVCGEMVRNDSNEEHQNLFCLFYRTRRARYVPPGARGARRSAAAAVPTLNYKRTAPRVQLELWRRTIHAQWWSAWHVARRPKPYGAPLHVHNVARTDGLSLANRVTTVGASATLQHRR